MILIYFSCALYYQLFLITLRHLLIYGTSTYLYLFIKYLKKKKKQKPTTILSLQAEQSHNFQQIFQLTAYFSKTF